MAVFRPRVNPCWMNTFPPIPQWAYIVKPCVPLESRRFFPSAFYNPAPCPLTKVYAGATGSRTRGRLLRGNSAERLRPAVSDPGRRSRQRWESVRAPLVLASPRLASRWDSRCHEASSRRSIPACVIISGRNFLCSLWCRWDGAFLRSVVADILFGDR